ncbi:MAG: rod shape-determining protein [Lachnospiraceae bacterium]|nr:rod shape-determining protein [Lachnospiraceae bacterium]
MFNKSVFGVDLGTSAVKIYSQRSKRTIVEKDMIAIRNRTQVIAVGNEAFEIYEKNPPNIIVDRPVINGNIADVAEVDMMLRVLLARCEKHMTRFPVLYCSAPVNMSEIERRSYYALSHVRALGNPHVYLVDRPICDALALGIPVTRTRGTMIVNMGAKNTVLSVIAGEQVIISSRIPIGGQDLNDAICNEIRKRNNLLIGKRTARRLKAVLASFDPSGNEARKVHGLNTLSGLPRECVVSAALVSEAVERKFSEVASAMKTFLERVPPQLGKYIIDEGIYVTGGTSRIQGIDQYLSQVIGCRINLSPYYEQNTIQGLQELINHSEYQKFAYAIRKNK